MGRRRSEGMAAARWCSCNGQGGGDEAMFQRRRRASGTSRGFRWLPCRQKFMGNKTSPRPEGSWGQVYKILSIYCMFTGFFGDDFWPKFYFTNTRSVRVALRPGHKKTRAPSFFFEN